jgi:hypothetical protein
MKSSLEQFIKAVRGISSCRPPMEMERYGFLKSTRAGEDRSWWSASRVDTAISQCSTCSGLTVCDCNGEDENFFIVKRALEEPLRLIASNAGHEGAIIIGKVRDSAKANYGFNAETEEYTDMISAGILDPAKVTRSALQNAASIAALMLTTEALIAEIPGQEPALRCRAEAVRVCTSGLHDSIRQLPRRYGGGGTHLARRSAGV